MNEAKSVIDYLSEIEFLIHQKPLEHAEYYLISKFAEDDGRLYYLIDSHWVGFTKDPIRGEIREASLVDPEATIRKFKELHRPVLVINSIDDLVFFQFVIGGHAIIEGKLARNCLKSLLIPKPMVRTYDKGYVNIDSVPSGKFNYAPNPKLRMKILDRDKRRCKICGASPASNEHVELNLHHIHPHGKGGLTEEENLITICRTCHKGLDPHEDLSLYASIGIKRVFEKEFSESYTESLNRNIQALSKCED
jgi:hypothetical protein